MTETEWRAAATPTPMLEAVRGWATPRQLRLFAVACCRRVGGRFDPVAVPAVEAAERYADGRGGWAEVAAADRAIEEEFEASSWSFEGMYCGRAVAMADPWAAAAEAARHAVWVPEPAGFPNLIEGGGLSAGELAAYHRACDDRDRAEEAAQAALARCVFGGPRPPAAFDPSWRTEAAVALAHGIYEDRAFDRLPVLADALEDAGCADPDILAHCRGDCPHVRGCWVVDLVLGKG